MVEGTCDGRGIAGVESVDLLHGVEVVEEELVAGVGLGRILNGGSVFVGNVVAVGVPVVVGAVDDLGGDALVDNATHYLVNHALLGQTCIALVVVGL